MFVDTKPVGPQEAIINELLDQSSEKVLYDLSTLQFLKKHIHDIYRIHWIQCYTVSKTLHNYLVVLRKIGDFSWDIEGVFPGLNVYGFTGQHSDSVTGLDYYAARYYDPVVGQFLSADVVQGNAQGMNPYAYVGGNPETKTDPPGQMYTGSGGGSDGPNQNDCNADPSLSGCRGSSGGGKTGCDAFDHNKYGESCGSPHPGPPHHHPPAKSAPSCPHGRAICGDGFRNGGRSYVQTTGMQEVDTYAQYAVYKSSNGSVVYNALWSPADGSPPATLLYGYGGSVATFSGLQTNYNQIMAATFSVSFYYKS